jgi:hypothetical protein
MQQSHQITLTSKAYEVEDFSAAQELYHSSGWTDGLPVVPPTESTVTACLEWALMPALAPHSATSTPPVRQASSVMKKMAKDGFMVGHVRRPRRLRPTCP